MTTKKYLLIVLSFIYGFIFPLNVLLAWNSFGIYIFISFLAYILLWLVPLWYLYKNNKNFYLYLILLIVLNFLAAFFIITEGQKYADKNEEVINKQIYQGIISQDK